MNSSRPTLSERAAWALARACNGWRKDGVCRDAAGLPRPEPHHGCLRAQLEHDLLQEEAARELKGPVRLRRWLV